ncbi:MAG: hypothetical protein IJA80_05045 [Clostridia bacterium]|nr:hypothetical protein [Clostridia bacterium]
MSALVCDLCGGKLKMGAGGIATCDSCGMEHSPDRMKEKVQEVKGTVKVDNSHMIENYLEMANRAYQSDNNAEAENYCNKIIEIEPNNYHALMLKGKTAGWQSTLQDNRFAEAINCFSSAIENAPDEEKEELIYDAKEQVENLSLAIIKLQGGRFEKWPDEEEATGLLKAIGEVYKALILFTTSVGGDIIDSNKLMAPIATIVNNSVMGAWNGNIVPEYKNDSDGHPDDYAFKRLITKAGYCTDLLEQAINLSEEDDAADIVRYENLISIHNYLINSCSYEYRTVEIVGNFWNDYQSSYENRYCKNLELTDAAKNSRRNSISQYRAKIDNIKQSISRKEAAERAEKERIEREEAQKRYEAYWKEHIDERKQLEAELESIKAKINQLNSNYNVEIEDVNKQILELPGYTEISHLDERINQLMDNKNSLGIFKVKEKKTLQEQIDKLISEKNNIKDRMESDKKELEAKLIVIRDEINSKITPLRNRENTITNELNKPR